MSHASSILDAIGNTPLIAFENLPGQRRGSHILAKLEYLNPSGSIKDRIALEMVQEAENAGLLSPGNTIIEASTGNTGIALSLVASVKGYHMLVYAPKEVSSEERMAIMKSYGAKICRIDTEKEMKTIYKDLHFEKGLHGGITEIIPRKRCLELESARDDVWWARQFSNPANVSAHRGHTGGEILRQVRQRIDGFVASIGTGGTLLGVAQALRAENPSAKVVCVEPAENPMLSQGRENFPLIEGITDGIIWHLIENRQKLIDRIIRITADEAIDMMHILTKKYGVFCGVSSGANVLAALRYSQELGGDCTIVTVLPDRRDRYFTKEQYVT